MAAYLDVCRFNPQALPGTADWTYTSIVTGYQSPTLAGAVNGSIYRYRAESLDLTLWEIGYGTYSSGTGVFTRAVVLYNSSGTGTAAGQSGAGTKINFSGVTPQVGICLLAEDLTPLTNAFINYRYIAGAGQTALSGADANSATLQYTVGNLDVWRNGSLLTNGQDYTASNGSLVTLLAAAVLNDKILIKAYTTGTVSAFSLAQQCQYTANASQTAFTGADLNGVVLATNGQFTQVFQNGRLLNVTSDYTLTSTTVTLVTGATVGDTIAVVSLNTISSAAVVQTNAAQGLTSTDSVSSGVGAPSQQTQARQNIYAAPFDSMSYNGIQVNGSMDVSQENGATQITLVNNTPKYSVDGFSSFYNHTAATAVFKAQQVTPPGSPSFGAGFSNCLQLTATTLSAMAAAGDFAQISTPIEGYRWAKLGFGNATNQQSVAIGFWVYATIAGTMSVSLRNSATSRSYISNVVINNATTWEYKTVYIPADTSTPWLTTNGVGAYVGFCFGAGSTFQGTNNAWQATTGSGLFATSSTTNFFASNNNTVCITGLIVLPGIELPSSARAPFIMRPFDQELVTCQRYWEKTWDYGIAVGSTFSDGINAGVVSSGDHGSYGAIPWVFSKEKRATPTVVSYDGAGTSNKYSYYTGSAWNNAATAGNQAATTKRFVAEITGQYMYAYNATADARL